MAATWAKCYVNRAGPAENGTIYIHLKADDGSFNHWFQANPGMKKEMLATALAALHKGTSVQTYLSDTIAYSEVRRLYLSAT